MNAADLRFVAHKRAYEIFRLHKPPKWKDTSFAQPCRLIGKWRKSFLFMQVRHALKWMQWRKKRQTLIF